MNYAAVPLRHGMTVGELAKLFNAERHINANLTVVSRWRTGCAETGLIQRLPELLDRQPGTKYPRFESGTALSRRGADRRNKHFCRAGNGYSI